MAFLFGVTTKSQDEIGTEDQKSGEKGRRYAWTEKVGTREPNALRGQMPDMGQGDLRERPGLGNLISESESEVNMQGLSFQPWGAEVMKVKGSEVILEGQRSGRWFKVRQKVRDGDGESTGLGVRSQRRVGSHPGGQRSEGWQESEVKGKQS